MSFQGVNLVAAARDVLIAAVSKEAKRDETRQPTVHQIMQNAYLEHAAPPDAIGLW
jgi:hypothetical protein